MGAEKFVKAFNLSPAIVTITSLESGRIVEVNDNFVRVSGYTREEAIGRIPTELGLWVKPAERERALDYLRTRGPVEDLEIEVRTKAGEIRIGRVSGDIITYQGERCVLSVFSDITDQKRIEEDLETSRRLFERILEASPDVIFVFDIRRSRTVYANRGIAAALGHSAEQIMAMSGPELVELFPAEQRAALSETIRALEGLSEGGINESEYRVRRADGQWLWFRSRAVPFLRGPDGKVRQFLCVAQDVTDRKRAEEAAQEAEHRFRLAIEASGVGTYDIDLEQNVGRWSPELLSIYGLPPDSAPDRQTLRSMIHPDDRAQVQAAFESATRDGGPDRFHADHRIVRPNGEIRIVEVKGIMIRVPSANGPRAIRAIGAVMDLTEQRQADESLRNSEKLFRSLADTAPAMIWTAAPDGRLTFHNRRWLEYSGLTPEENTADWPRRVVHPDDYDRCLALWAQALATGTDYEIEVRNRRHDGEYRWFLTRATPVRDERGEITAWFGSTTDIHDKKQTEQERERLLREMADLDRRKDEFLAMLSHELRNPLAPIRNAVQLLQTTGEQDLTRLWAHAVIDRQVEHLSRLIDDLLDVSRITSGKVVLDRKPVEFSEVLADVIDASRPWIEARKHRLTVSYPAEPIWLDGDRMRLVQIFTNLVNNAAKYTEEGGRIWLTASRTPDELVVIVRDTGMGIPAALLPHVFTLFTQGEGSLARSQGGLGIGLSLVKTLVEMHGGSVCAASDGPGLGSEFTVRLPALAAAPKARTSGPIAQAGERAAPARILVVDDNRDLAESTAMLLQLSGHDVQVAYDGAEALERARSFQPTAVLLDVGLPGMDGYEVARSLRGSPEYGSPVVIGLTGYGMAEDRARSKEAGFDHHLVKPVDFSTLERVLIGGQPDTPGP